MSFLKLVKNHIEKNKNNNNKARSQIKSNGE